MEFSFYISSLLLLLLNLFILLKFFSGRKVDVTLMGLRAHTTALTSLKYNNKIKHIELGNIIHYFLYTYIFFSFFFLFCIYIYFVCCCSWSWWCLEFGCFSYSLLFCCCWLLFPQKYPKTTTTQTTTRKIYNKKMCCEFITFFVEFFDQEIPLTGVSSLVSAGRSPAVNLLNSRGVI